MTPPVDPELLELAVRLAREAGTATLEWFADPGLVVERKVDGTPVTVADRAAERLLRAALARAVPDDAVTGEEEAATPGTSGRVWTLDPIDGTKAFARGVPLYATLVAMADRHGPAIGVIHLPALGETVYAGRGRGCFFARTPVGDLEPFDRRVRPCAVSDTTDLASAYLCTSALSNWTAAARDAVLSAVAGVRTWGDAYGYSLVATGRADAMVDPVIEPYDVAPMLVILPEAGGAFTDFGGERRADGGNALATNGRLHDEVRELVRR